MIIPIGSTEPITLGPFLTSAGTPVSGVRPAVTLYANGSSAYAPGSSAALGATDSRGVASYTPNPSDMGVQGELLVVATVTGAMEWFRWHQIGPAEANAVEIAGQEQSGLIDLTALTTGLGYFLGELVRYQVSGDPLFSGDYMFGDTFFSGLPSLVNTAPRRTASCGGTPTMHAGS